MKALGDAEEYDSWFEGLRPLITYFLGVAAGFLLAWLIFR